MSALITADLHLSENPRDGYRFAIMREIRLIAENEKVSQIIILGDLTEEKDRHGAWLVNEIVSEIAKLAEVAPVFILKGNHDYVVEDSPFFGFLSRLRRVDWIGQPHEEAIDGLGHCMFLPHTRDYKRDWADLALTGNDWVFAHNTFEGAVVGHGREMKGIPTDIFGKSRDYVIAGDVHVPHRIGPVTYVGSPSLVDFGDDYEPRVLILEEGQKPTSIVIEGKQKRLIEIDGPQRIESGYTDAKANQGDLIKVRIKLTSEQYQDWHKIKSTAAWYANECGFDVYSIVPVVERNGTKALSPKGKSVTKSDEDYLRQFAKTVDVDPATTDAGMKLLQET